MNLKDSLSLMKKTGALSRYITYCQYIRPDYLILGARLTLSLE
jgi:hypothetical protein